jgi:maltooligosyltrehalose trehalohydrolase
MNGSQATVAAPSNPLGAAMVGKDLAKFLVWAPVAETVDVRLFGSRQRVLPLERIAEGYFGGVFGDVPPGTRYKYRLNGKAELPDPASRSQPEGVHGPSEITSEEFHWSDHEWRGIPLGDCIFYELHVGTFTREGTFDAAIAQLDYLAQLGITAVELMPVAQFPGDRNWGYDGVYPFAVQKSYGGPAGLKRFVDAAHAKGLAVVLDVVYNHLGPEGNYLAQFGPYFTDRYHTPWGLAVNFDGPASGAVRRFVVENALRWVTEFHIDALRLDAVHMIFDHSPRHILQELAEAVHARGAELGRLIHVIAESDLNDSRLVEAVDGGGYGLDAQWSDDFHHALHGLLTKERAGYYQDFGEIRHLAKALAEGFVYSGQFSEFRGCNHGSCSAHLPGNRFVVCTQNHDQIGNRMLGERFSAMLEFEHLKLAAGALLMSPYLPLLFMGQEYGEPAPFLYFVSHSDPDLIEAVRQGRQREFAAFSWKGEVPDAQAVETFDRSRLDHSLREAGNHRSLLEFYRRLITIRKSVLALNELRRESSDIVVSDKTIVMRRAASDDEAIVMLHFGEKETPVSINAAAGAWEKILDSSEPRWRGPGSSIPHDFQSDGAVELSVPPYSVCVFHRRV